jgi:hypothetical protein
LRCWRCSGSACISRSAPAAASGTGRVSRIVFNAGTHADAVSMRYQDFEALAHPTVGRFTMRL